MVEIDHQDFGGEVVKQPPVEHRGLCVRSGDADKDDGLAVNRGRNGVGLGDAAHVRRRGAAGPVPRGHLMARADKIAHHASTHRAETDEGDFAHCLPFRTGPCENR